MNKVAADLCFRASKARLLLQRQIFAVAATSAACLLLDDNDLLLEKQYQQLARQSYAKQSFNRREIRTSLPRSKKIHNQQHQINNIALANTASAQRTSLYIIGMLNLRRFCVFAPKIGDFERKIGANDTRKLLYYNNFRMSVFFFFFEKSFRVPKVLSRVCVYYITRTISVNKVFIFCLLFSKIVTKP